MIVSENYEACKKFNVVRIDRAKSQWVNPELEAIDMDDNDRYDHEKYYYVWEWELRRLGQPNCDEYLGGHLGRQSRRINIGKPCILEVFIGGIWIIYRKLI
jgi:hypothetical protein